MSRARKSKAEMNGNSLGVVSVEAGASAERSAGERSEPQRAAVLARPFSAATNVRRDQLDSVLLPEALVEPVRVVRLVADEVLGEFVEKAGSARESGRPCDFGGFFSVVKFGSRSRRCGGNVEASVLCGFPSSEGGTETLRPESQHSAIGASFPQQTLDS
jgi:hypothetical protein